MTKNVMSEAPGMIGSGASPDHIKAGKGKGMIEGDFLTADDLGPLGRLAHPGELLVLDPRDAGTVRRERDWIRDRYLEADNKAEAFRKRLLRARLGDRGDAVRELFELWTIEAAKLALCDSYLRIIESKLNAGEQQGMQPPKTFRWHDVEQIREVVNRVTGATDSEIASGIVFRAR